MRASWNCSSAPPRKEILQTKPSLDTAKLHWKNRVKSVKLQEPVAIGNRLQLHIHNRWAFAASSSQGTSLQPKGNLRK
jgi:hypothetical protein